ncbi:MAG TPA: sulfurtransferase, partial [Thermodesulfobacteriota bacterium]
PDDASAIDYDYLFFVHDRHQGNLEASRRCLVWEMGLVDQMDERERAEFRLLVPTRPSPADSP